MLNRSAQLLTISVCLALQAMPVLAASWQDNEPPPTSLQTSAINTDQSNIENTSSAPVQNTTADNLNDHRHSPNEQPSLSVVFTDAEIAWLKAHPVIRVGVNRSFAPYGWVDARGNYVGLSADYMAHIEQRLGVKLDVIDDQPWAEILKMAQQGKLDMLANANKTPAREKYLFFTEPYIDTPIAIVDNGSVGFVSSLKQLDGKRIAVERGYFMQELLTKNHPSMQLEVANTVKDALFMVNKAKADVYIGDAASVMYVIKQENLHLGIAGETPYRSWQAIAISKTHPELASLIVKALADIPQIEKENLKAHWLSLTVDQGIKIKLESIIQYGIAGLLLLVISTLWNLLLQREMHQRKTTELELRRKQEELKVNQEQLDFALKGANDGLWDWNLKTNDIFYSIRWKNMLGYADQDLSNRLETWLDLIHPDDKNRILQQVDNYLSGNSPKFEVEFRMRHRQGHWIHILSRARLALDNNGELLYPKRLIGTHVDITERIVAEEELRKAASVFAHTQEGIVITDIHANIIDTNQAFSKITGYSKEEVLGRNPRFLKSGHHDDEFYSSIWKTIKRQGFWAGEIWNRKKTGDAYVEWLTISAVTDDNSEITHYIGNFTDITALKEHEQQLERIAHYDPLTGIPNRVLLADRMQLAVAQTKREECMMVVGYLDLDGFKPVNDRWGHEAGDRLLVEITNRIKDTLREGDTIARLGGDEFVFLLLNLNKFEECEIIIHRLLEVISAPIEIQSQMVTVSASIGISIFPDDNTVPDTLLRHADQAMYQAKQDGKNCYRIYNHALDVKHHLRRTALNRIEKGLFNNEFELFFQPKVDMRHGVVFGAEALIRWQHPERHLVLPGEFMPAMENQDLATKLDLWVIDSALKQMQQWRKQGMQLQISVNISAKSLQADDFVKQLNIALLRYPSVNPTNFELEILETEALNDMSLTSQIIQDCQKLGVQFALDDFGTGYSSLSYLKYLPAQTLKIDRSFVRDMLDDEEDLAIVKGVIGLADSFKRKVIAEGVETIEHGRILLNMGCHYAQGYGIAKPMPAHDIILWLETWQMPTEWK